VLACPRELSRLIALDELRIVLALDAADLHKHRRLEIDPWSLTSWLTWSPYFFGASLAAAHLRVSTCKRATARDVYVFWRGLVRYLKGFLEELVSLRLARAYLSRKSSNVADESTRDRGLRTKSPSILHGIRTIYHRRCGLSLSGVTSAYSPDEPLRRRARSARCRRPKRTYRGQHATDANDRISM
jgi:hypothetical protein